MTFYFNGAEFFKTGYPRTLLSLFSVFFKQTAQILQQINVKKCPTSIRCRDLNKQPLDYESPPLTTRLVLLLSFEQDFVVSPSSDPYFTESVFR